MEIGGVMTVYPKSQVNITIDSRVYIGLQKLAKTAGMTTTGYATQLFGAAYAARHKPTGDRELDEAVARMSRPAAQVDTTSIKVIAQLEAQVTELRGKLTELAKKPIISQQPPAPADEALRTEIRSLSDRLVEAASHKRQLDTARAEIDQLRTELEARPLSSPSIPDTALGRFLNTWNAELRTAA